MKTHASLPQQSLQWMNKKIHVIIFKYKHKNPCKLIIISCTKYAINMLHGFSSNYLNRLTKRIEPSKESKVSCKEYYCIFKKNWSHVFIQSYRMILTITRAWTAGVFSLFLLVAELVFGNIL